MGCHALLQGIFPTQGSNPCLLCLLHWQEGTHFTNLFTCLLILNNKNMHRIKSLQKRSRKEGAKKGRQRQALYAAAAAAAKSLQSCPTLGDLMDCSPPGSSVHEILQARILKWVAMPFSRASSQTRDQTCVSYVSCIGRWVLYHWCHLRIPN